MGARNPDPLEGQPLLLSTDTSLQSTTVVLCLLLYVLD